MHKLIPLPWWRKFWNSSSVETIYILESFLHQFPTHEWSCTCVCRTTCISRVWLWLMSVLIREVAHSQPQSKLSEWVKFLTDQSQMLDVFKFSRGIQKNEFMCSNTSKTPVMLLTDYIYCIALITTVFE